MIDEWLLVYRNDLVYSTEELQAEITRLKGAIMGFASQTAGSRGYTKFSISDLRGKLAAAGQALAERTGAIPDGAAGHFVADMSDLRGEFTTPGTTEIP